MELEPVDRGWILRRGYPEGTMFSGAWVEIAMMRKRPLEGGRGVGRPGFVGLVSLGSALNCEAGDEGRDEHRRTRCLGGRGGVVGCRPSLSCPVCAMRVV